jgi:hypothetical protein
MKSIAICNALLVLFCIRDIPALAGPKSGVEYTHSGSGATTFFSFDGKGVAFLASTAGTGDLGKFTNQELSRGQYTGGTGKYAGASGTFITTFDGVTLAAPSNPGVGAFGTANEHTRADLKLQNGD